MRQMLFQHRRPSSAVSLEKVLFDESLPKFALGHAATIRNPVHVRQALELKPKREISDSPHCSAGLQNYPALSISIKYLLRLFFDSVSMAHCQTQIN